MAHYEYQAQTANGETTKGTVEALTVSQAVSELEAQGLTILAIGQVATAAAGQDGVVPISAFQADGNEPLRQLLANAMQESASLLPALRAAATEQSAGLRRQHLAEFVNILDRGDVPAAVSSIDRLAEHWIPLISAARAGQAAGALPRFFREWRDANQLSVQSRLAVSYAVIVLSLAGIVLAGLCAFVVPTFTNIFAGFGLKLPALTRFVMSLSEGVISGRILALIAAVVLLVGGVWFGLRFLPSGLKAAFGDRFGTFFGRSAALARFMGCAADLLEAELQPGMAIRLAGAATRSPRLARAARRWQPPEPGNRARADLARPILPTTVQYALAAEIAGASQIALLRELSRVYSERALARSSWTRGIVEPLAVVLIGFSVGAVVLALFMPLISLIQGLS